MPVRIYDISKKLGLENKEVLAKAKALGIAAAKVASSSLDKITAEYLEEQIIKEHPHLAAPAPAPAPVAAVPLVPAQATAALGVPDARATAPGTADGKSAVSPVVVTARLETPAPAAQPVAPVAKTDDGHTASPATQMRAPAVRPPDGTP